MPADYGTLGLLMIAAGAAGFVDSIAGGGGLITLPALLLAGLPPASAVATNKLQSVFGLVMASTSYHRSGYLDLASLKPAIACTAVGAALGAWAVSLFDTRLLAQILPFALLLAAAYFALAPTVRESVSRRSLSALAFATGIAAPIGFYDGFFGPGAGSLYTLGFVALTGAGLLQATANTKVLNLTSNILALAVFMRTSHIDYLVGLPMAVCQVTGAWLGSRAALRHGAKLIRPLLVATTTLVALKLLLAR